MSHIDPTEYALDVKGDTSGCFLKMCIVNFRAQYNSWENVWTSHLYTTDAPDPKFSVIAK